MKRIPMSFYVTKTVTIHEENPHIEVISELKPVADTKEAPVGCVGDVFSGEISVDPMCAAAVEKEALDTNHWSGGDQKMLASIEDDIRYATPPEERGHFEYNCKIHWLRSLKPHPQWVPTDEQMSALKEVCIRHSDYNLCRLYDKLDELKNYERNNKRNI